jgi:hypothetical protein
MHGQPRDLPVCQRFRAPLPPAVTADGLPPVVRAAVDAGVFAAVAARSALPDAAGDGSSWGSRLTCMIRANLPAACADEEAPHLSKDTFIPLLHALLLHGPANEVRWRLCKMRAAYVGTQSPARYGAATAPDLQAVAIARAAVNSWASVTDKDTVEWAGTQAAADVGGMGTQARQPPARYSTGLAAMLQALLPALARAAGSTRAARELDTATQDSWYQARLLRWLLGWSRKLMLLPPREGSGGAAAQSRPSQLTVKVEAARQATELLRTAAAGELPRGVAAHVGVVAAGEWVLTAALKDPRLLRAAQRGCAFGPAPAAQLPGVRAEGPATAA